MREYYKGSKRTVGMKLNARKNIPYNIEWAEYYVKNCEGETVQDGTATVEGREVSFLADTTLELYEKGQIYYAYFTVKINNTLEIVKGSVGFKVI